MSVFVAMPVVHHYSMTLLHLRDRVNAPTMMMMRMLMTLMKVELLCCRLLLLTILTGRD
jgi:hypothetical protein